MGDKNICRVLFKGGKNNFLYIRIKGKEEEKIENIYQVAHTCNCITAKIGI